MEQSAQNESGSVQTVEQTIATPTVATGFDGPPKPAPTVQSPFHAPPKEDAGWIRWMVFLIIFIAVAMGAAYLEYQTKYNRPAPVETTPVVIQKLPTPTPDETTSWQEVTLETLQFKVPNSWWIHEFVDGQGNKGYSINPTELPIPSDAVPAFLISFNKNTTIQQKESEITKDYGLQNLTETALALGDGARIVDGTTSPGFLEPYEKSTLFVQKGTDLYTLQNTRPLVEGEDYFDKITETFIFVTASPTLDEPVVCTQEAKQCADGSYVSRTGPNCEFTKCPGQ